MIPFFFIRNISLFAVVWVVHSLAYSGVLRKMGLGGKWALIPLAAEGKMARILFVSLRVFLQAVFTAILFFAASRYVGRQSMYGIIFWLAGLVLYHIFVLRLVWRISKSFGKGVLFRILAMFCPVPCLLILGYGRAQFRGMPEFRIKSAPLPVRIFSAAVVFLVTAAEFLLLVGVVSFLSIRENPPRILSEEIAKDGIEKAAGIKEQGGLVRREDVMDAQALEAAMANRSRDYYYPDHSGDENVVVMEYFVATDLETRSGMASINIAQIREAAKEGTGLTVVMQAGAARYMFTDGMEDGSCARYAVSGGKIEKVMDLDPATCMTEGKSLSDFIRWTRENYPADRYMLVLWDHGGGFPMGYGADQLNEREDGEQFMPCSDLVEAVRDGGVQFDLIGFDTCLMQDIDLVYSLEPYADYYLASEESESGFGWNYTLGFAGLAKDPGISTEEFGALMVSGFDPYNTKLNEGEKDTASTLSLVDMTLVKPAHEKLEQLFERERQAVLESPENYANISIAATGAYAFGGDYQIDLIDYLEKLDGLDYENAIQTDRENQELIDAVRACVVFRNENSASGVNGMAFCFPVKAMEYYGDTHKQYEKLGLETQKSMTDDFFSIMAYQQQHGADDFSGGILALLTDYTQEEWYIKGFEDYDTANTFIDIPLKDTGAGYQIELPEKAWKSISDCQTVVYLRTEEGRMYLGSDHIGSLDDDGNPLVAMDDTWPHVGGTLICYYADPARETDQGTVFSGRTKALLNGRKEIELYIECDPVNTETGEPAEAYIAGYELVNDLFAFSAKGRLNLEAGDTLEFLFDYYDDEGNLIKTAPYGKKVRVTSDRRIPVTDEPLGECDIRFGGRLTDVYQRTFLTELLDAHVGK